MKIKQKKKYIIRIILIIAIVLWMSVIFGFSAANAEQSSATSGRITRFVVELLYQDYNDLEHGRQQEIWDNVSFIVRKIGHFGEYCILAVLVSLLVLTFSDKWKRIPVYFLIVILFCAIYAITDELHQGFVDGRSPKVFDVCIDTLGAFTGSIFVRIGSYIRTSFRR